MTDKKKLLSENGDRGLHHMDKIENKIGNTGNISCSILNNENSLKKICKTSS